MTTSYIKTQKIKYLILGMVVTLVYLFSSQALFASEVTGTITTGLTSGETQGTVVVAPTASPVANTYTSAQSVTLTATGSTSIHYTTSGTDPTCTTGTTYSGAITVASTTTIEAISCYPNSNASTVASFAYTINISSGGGSSGGSSNPPANNYLGCTTNTGFSTTTGKTCVGYVVPTTGLSIPGCGNRTTGFSTATGQSCVGNVVTSPALPSGGSNAGGNSSNLANMPAGGGSTYNFGTTTLKNGSKGEAVKELQRFLNAKLNLGLVIDGMLGPKTIAVIKKWQKDNGLVPDGLIGPKTKVMMNK